MKQILLFLLLAGQFVQALTQVNAPNRTDKEGLRTGEWVIYFQQDDQVTDNPSGATRYYLVNYKKENRKDSHVNMPSMAPSSGRANCVPCCPILYTA